MASWHSNDKPGLLSLVIGNLLLKYCCCFFFTVQNVCIDLQHELDKCLMCETNWFHAKVKLSSTSSASSHFVPHKQSHSFLRVSQVACEGMQNSSRI